MKIILFISSLICLASCSSVRFPQAGEEPVKVRRLTKAETRHIKENKPKRFASLAIVDPGALHATDKAGNTGLHLVAAQGRLEFTESFIKSGLDLERANLLGRTALLSAAYTGKADTVEALIKAGANPHAIDQEGNGLLHLASFSGAKDLLKVLATLDLKTDLKNNLGETPLHVAAKYGNEAFIVHFLTGGADVNELTKSGDNALTLVLAAEEESESSKLMILRQTKDLEHKNKNQQNALHLAAFTGKMVALSELLRLGVDLEAKDGEGRSALQLAVSNGQIETAIWLIAKGANVNNQNNKGESVFMEAMFWRHMDLDSALISSQPKLGLKAWDGRSELHYAAFSGNIRLLRYLKDQGQDLQAVDKQGNNALLIAVQLKHPDAVQQLISYKCNVNQINSKGVSCLELGLGFDDEDTEILEMLLKTGVDVNSRNSLGSTALHEAVNRNQANKIKLLLKAGADVKLKDEQGRTPAELARLREFPRAYRAITEFGN